MKATQYAQRNPTFPTCPTCSQWDPTTGHKIYALLERGLCPACRRVFVPWLSPDAPMPPDAYIIILLPGERVTVASSYSFIKAPFAIDGWLPLPEAKYE